MTSWVISNAVYAPSAKSLNDSSFRYSGSNCGSTWCSTKQKGAYRGDDHWSSQPDSYYTLTFSGTQARVYGSRANDHGIASFSVDGGAETDVDLYAASHTDNELIYATPSLLPGPHSLKVRVSGLKNANATNVIVQADRGMWFRSNWGLGLCLGLSYASSCDLARHLHRFGRLSNPCRPEEGWNSAECPAELV